MASGSGINKAMKGMSLGSDEAGVASEMLTGLKIDEKNITSHSHVSIPVAPGSEPAPTSSSVSTNSTSTGPVTPAARTLNITSRPTVVLLIGMAGAGKTSLAQRFAATLMEENRSPYIINLDPACLDPPYPVNIDIRDTVNYKQVMEKYHLGPNGAIVTSLNLFCTRFNQIIDILLSKPLTKNDFVLVDTPGQIEVFMWSASGQIILQSFAAVFPTVILYVSDLTTNINPITFISNMTYACSILYKSKLPLVITLNKCDVKVKAGCKVLASVNEDGEEAMEQEEDDTQSDNQVPATTYAEQWIRDFEVYQDALGNYESYSTNLASSLSLAMDEFYSHIEYASVSAKTGKGMDKLFASIGKALEEYEKLFLPMMERQIKQREKELQKRAAAAAGGSGAAKHKKELSDLSKQMTKAVPTKKSKFAKERDGDDGATGPSLFSIPATSGATQGFSLSLGMDFDEEDTSSEEEEEAAPESDDNEDDKESFRQFFEREIQKRKDRDPPQ